ncbi:MAG: NAD(P)-dependent alcohol dehydrogenase [Ornithinimicrobium sp.]|uniref:NAD(P)-dependent alcohol dehydrogenase n=1 Tax=Ornithinimicrobium sp. TaxID=1977084 RepID=UPI003D9B0C0E
MVQIPSTMRVNVLLGQRQVEMQERPVPRPAPGDVLVRVRSVGVCGSDVHYYMEGRIGPYVVESPLVLGHEVSGVIADVGDGVSPERIGQRVAIEPQRPCRRCRHCKNGRSNLCEQMEFYATPPIDGTFCDYVVAPADYAHPVPDALSDHAAALLEPFSVGIWACQKAGVQPGDTVLVTGGGPIGALTCLAARSFGAGRVVVTDLVPSRRERILGFGATEAHDPADPDFDPAAIEADAFIECSGATPAVHAGLAALRSGGTAVLVGLGPPEIPIPVGLVAMKEIVLTGVFRYVDTWPRAIAAAQQQGVDLDALVTAEYELEDAEDALTSDSDPESMKSVVVVPRA